MGKLQSGMIVAVLPVPLQSDYFAGVVQGITNVTQASGYQPEISIQHPDHENILPYLLAQENCLGVVAVVPLNHGEIVEMCRQHHKNYVLIDYPTEESRHVPTVEVDNFGGIHQVMEHLLQLGHTRIGFITGRLRYKSAVQRLQAYHDALASAGIPHDPDLIGEGDWEHPAAFKQAIRLLKLENRPTAIVTSNDYSAFGAIQAAQELGLEVSRDLSVTGFDDIPMAATFTPAITTVCQPTVELGEIATHMLIKRIAGEPLPQLHVKLSTELIIRDSTGPAPTN